MIPFFCLYFLGNLAIISFLAKSLGHTCISLVLPRLLLSNTVHELESGLITIPALCFQVETYKNFGIVSHWLIEKKQYTIGRKEV